MESGVQLATWSCLPSKSRENELHVIESETTESEALVSEASLCTVLSVFVKAQVTIHRRLDTTVLRASAWILIDVKYILFRNFYDPEHESESILSRAKERNKNKLGSLTNYQNVEY